MAMMRKSCCDIHHLMCLHYTLPGAFNASQGPVCRLSFSQLMSRQNNKHGIGTISGAAPSAYFLTVCEIHHSLKLELQHMGCNVLDLKLPTVPVITASAETRCNS